MNCLWVVEFIDTLVEQALLQMLNFASVIASGLMIWKGLGLVMNTESPIVVVLRCVLPSSAISSTCSQLLFVTSRYE